MNSQSEEPDKTSSVLRDRGRHDFVWVYVWMTALMFALSGLGLLTLRLITNPH